MTYADAKARIAKLRKEVARHRYLYHVLNRQEISDEALDSLKHELARLESEFPDLVTPDSPTQRVAGKPLPGFRKVRHRVRMTSLADVFSREELAAWEERIKKLAGDQAFDYFAEIKIDGFAVSLQYQDGILKTGSTRGDGIVGEDVTENLKTIDSIPLALHDPKDFFQEEELQYIVKKFPRARAAVARIPNYLEVRGEVYMTKQAFAAANRAQERAGLPRFANPRNIAAGSIRQLDPKIAASRKLDFFAYDIVTDLGQHTHEEEHLIAQMFGFRTMEFVRSCRTLREVEKFWNDILERREHLPFLIDGIVVQVNSLSLFDELGVVGKAPRGAIAYKFPGSEATTIVREITVQVGRTGVLTPVAILDPVQIGGVCVSRATLHNMDEISRLDVRVGDTVVVQRAGDVIPAIVRVLVNLRPHKSYAYRMPKTFCGQPVVRHPGEAAHRILHPEKCDLVTREQMQHFVSKHAFDIQGLGPKIIDRLMDEGLVEDPADFFLLQEGDLSPLERFAEKSAENLIQSIQKKKEITLPRLIYALGIPHVGEETAIDLAEQFGTLEGLARASREDLAAIVNIGPVVAESIADWFGQKRHQEFVTKLMRVGVMVRHQKTIGRRLTLKGKTFVVTGTLESLSRDGAREKIRARGGDISESVSRITDFCVVGANPGSKFEHAKKMGVKILNEKELIKLIQ